MNEKKALTVDNDTYAGNPGNATLKPMIWAKHNFQTVSWLTLSFILSIFLTLKFSWWFAPLVFITAFVNSLYWLRKKEHFRVGDSNGGLVISVKPNLVAVATDLTTGFGWFPVIKIIKYPTNQSIQLGDKIATVALYTGSRDESLPHWMDFSPVPLDFATDSKTEFKAALESYPIEQWNNLIKDLDQIPMPYQPGIYKVNIETSDWADSTIEIGCN